MYCAYNLFPQRRSTYSHTSFRISESVDKGFSQRLMHYNGWTVNVCSWKTHYNDVIMSAMASQITSLTIVYSGVYWGADHRKHQSSASLSCVRGIHRSLVNSPHKGPVTRKMFPFDDVIMQRKSNPYHQGLFFRFDKSVSRLCIDKKFSMSYLIHHSSMS